MGVADGKVAATSGVDMPETSIIDEDEDEEETFGLEQAALYRAIGARCNYIQPDRPDI